MYIIGIDCETTGLSASSDRLTEIGAVLWETESKAPVLFFNTLIDPETPLSPEIIELTGITQEQINKFSIPENKALSKLNEFLNYSEVLVAHNAPFDRGFLETAYKRYEYKVTDKLWVDTKIDITYPKKIETRKLKHLACEHGIINPFSHRATTDVLTMLQMLSNYDIHEIVANAKVPSVLVRAFASFDDHLKAKGRGYSFDRPKKIWTKTIKENQLAEERSYFSQFNIALEIWK